MAKRKKRFRKEAPAPITEDRWQRMYAPGAEPYEVRLVKMRSSIRARGLIQTTRWLPEDAGIVDKDGWQKVEGEAVCWEYPAWLERADRPVLTPDDATQQLDFNEIEKVLCSVGF